jgi:hypothetical protein
MPLPGTDVAYPGGELGVLYRDFLRMDGLDPSDFSRKQRCEFWKLVNLLMSLQGILSGRIVSEDPSLTQGSLMEDNAIH